MPEKAFPFVSVVFTCPTGEKGIGSCVGKAGAERVIGSRGSGTILPGAMPRHHRYIGNPLLNRLLNPLIGLSISEIPTIYHARKGRSKLRSFRDGWRHLRFMVQNVLPTGF